MCEIGDIIVIEKYKDGNNDLSRHSFVVIQDEGGCIRGLSFDIVALVMSSFKDEQQRQRKMQYDNFPIVPNDRDLTEGGNEKDGYIKADQFYFFQKANIQYRVIGKLKDDILLLLFEFIETELKEDPKIIIDNLKP